MKRHIFLYKSIGLDPQIKMTNISASICPVCVILGSLEDSSHLVLSKSDEKLVISITNQLFLLSRSYKGQLKVKEKCCLKSFQLYLFYLHLVMGLVASNFRLILCMSTISRHVHHMPQCLCDEACLMAYRESRALRPSSRFLSLPIRLGVLNLDVYLKFQ